jgi:uncharacterized protein (DUF1810 family)
MTTVPQFAEFVVAQDAVYDQVLSELAAGKKETHWIWFIFPQMIGLGSSPMAQKYGIASKAAARSYVQHKLLGPRLRECTRLMLAIPHANIDSFMGFPDNLKFRSSMTLFAVAAPEERLFEEALKKFFGGERDPRTLELLGLGAEPHREQKQ